MKKPVTVTITVGCAGRRAGRDRDHHAARHRVAGVDHQVHQALLEQHRIDLDERRRPVGDVGQLDVGPDQPAQQRHQPGDGLGRIKRADVARLRSTEHEQLVDQRAGPLDAEPDVGGLAGDVGVGGAIADDRAAGADRGEVVVEVVGDAAGEETEGLELLARLQPLLVVAALGLGPPRGGDIDRGAEDVGGGADRERGGVDPQVTPLAVVA